MRPEQVAPFAITLAVVLVAFALMLLGWRRRRARGAALPVERPDAATLATAREAEHRYPVQYVATTFVDARLDRIAAPGLGFRGRAVLSVLTDAVVLEVDGEPPVRIAASALRGTGAGTFTIDRVVERDGLQVVTWALGERDVDTALRARPEDRTALTAAITDLLPDTSAHPAGTPDETRPGGPRARS